MPHADDIAGLPSQPQPGVAARLLRRFGGVVREAVAGLVRPRHRPAAPNPNTPQPPSRRPARKPRTAPSPRPPRAGWIASWFGLRRRAAAPLSWLPGDDDALFTPQRCPDLSQEACDLFNTPVEDCDPDTLSLMLAALAGHIAAEIGMDAEQAEALFGTLWQRVGAPLGQPVPAQAPAEPPDAAPAAAQAEPDAPPAEPRQPPATPKPPEPRDSGTTGTAAAQPAPNPAVPPLPASRTRPLRRASHRVRRRRASPSRGSSRPTAPRRLRYAASTGPP